MKKSSIIIGLLITIKYIKKKNTKSSIFTAIKGEKPHVGSLYSCSYGMINAYEYNPMWEWQAQRKCHLLCAPNLVFIINLAGDSFKIHSGT